MPSAFRNSKTLAEWIQLDYFRRPRGLRRWRWWLSWLTFGACIALIGALYAWPHGKTFFQAGPVSQAHAMFNENCQQCHTEYGRTALKVLPWNAETVRAVPNSACEHCHDGPLHNAFLPRTQACAECHQEHRGRTALARVPDSDCTACHADLKNYRASDSPNPFDNKITSFSGDHRDFRLFDSPLDDGKLHFNHSVHLDGSRVMKRAETDPAETSRRLECTDCHVPDAAGRYMKPIKYETHCQECHQLNVRLSGSFGDEKTRQAAEAFAKSPVPHGLPPEQVRAVLRDRIIEFARNNPVIAKDSLHDRAVPRPRRLEVVSEANWTWSNQQLDENAKRLFSNEQLPEVEKLMWLRPAGCGYCHIAQTATKPGDLPHYELSQINKPEPWFRHSVFHHVSHRMLDCVECHTSASTSKLTSDVLLPRIEICKKCHNPTIGARSDCVECHIYHHHPNGVPATKNLSIDGALGK